MSAESELRRELARAQRRVRNLETALRLVTETESAAPPRVALADTREAVLMALTPAEQTTKAIVAQTRGSHKTVLRALRQLVAEGWAKEVSGNRRTNFRWIQSKPAAEPPAAKGPAAEQPHRAAGWIDAELLALVADHPQGVTTTALAGRLNVGRRYAAARLRVLQQAGKVRPAAPVQRGRLTTWLPAKRQPATIIRPGEGAFTRGERRAV